MKYILLCMFTLLSLAGKAQDFGAAINRNWLVYADDTSLTYQQITYLCDSLFAQAGFPIIDTTEDTAANQEEEEHELDGSPYRDYCLWKAFWYSRCDSNSHLHDMLADAMEMLNAQQKTTTAPTSCCGYQTQ